jgi:hypothetical protein
VEIDRQGDDVWRGEDERADEQEREQRNDDDGPDGSPAGEAAGRAGQQPRRRSIEPEGERAEPAQDPVQETDLPALPSPTPAPDCAG